MASNDEIEILLGRIENYLLDHIDEPVVITYSEGDSYSCRFDTDDWEDNGKDPSDPEYREWLTLDFRVAKTLVAGPNKDPRFDFISVSEKQLPEKIVCNGKVIYGSE